MIEHFVPRARDSAGTNLYSNAFYICRLCNIARGSAPVLSSAGERLLSPTDVAWSEHFRLAGDRILPLPDDRDAAYTLEVYDLNDERKVKMRSLRRISIRRALDFIRVSETIEKTLLEKAREASAFVDLAQKLQSHHHLAFQELNRFAAIPVDADTQCLCGTARHHVLPIWLGEQTLSLQGG